MKHLSRQSMAAGAADNGMHTDGVEDDDMDRLAYDEDDDVIESR